MKGVSVLTVASCLLSLAFWIRNLMVGESSNFFCCPRSASQLREENARLQVAASSGQKDIVENPAYKAMAERNAALGKEIAGLKVCTGSCCLVGCCW